MNPENVLEPYNQIKIDNFFPSKLGGNPADPGELIYILTHMHEDHLTGLVEEVKNGFFTNRNPIYDWHNGKIYVSVVTHRLMLLKFPNLEPYMIPLELGKE